MRNRIVVWGRNAQEERVLIAVELLMEQSIIKIQTFTEKDVSDEVYKNFMDKWRKEQDVELPEPQKVWARELSVSEDLLPEELKVEQGDMVNRAQTEWHYMVLSAKLKDAYRAELTEINDRIERAEKYDSNLWGQLKDFWNKVQQQLRDKTLLRDHGNEIRTEVDKLFSSMKEMRDKMSDEIKEKSSAAVTEFAAKLEELEAKTQEGTHLRKVFDELRKLQSKFHNTTFSRDDRKLVYDRIDAAFKAVKAKRNTGGSEAANNALGRVTSRYEGLLKAMEKMERSIQRDHKDLEFEKRRIANTDGQLEAQIRQAKIAMINSRVESKGEKLADMKKTKEMLEKRIKKEQSRVEKNQKREAERAAAEAVKAKIAADMKSGKAELSAEEQAKLNAAANAIKAGKKAKGKGSSDAEPNTTVATDIIANAAALSEVLSTTTEPAAKAPGLLDTAAAMIETAKEEISEAVEDVVDTAKAVAQVAGEKLEAAIEEVKEEIKEISGEEE